MEILRFDYYDTTSENYMISYIYIYDARSQVEYIIRGALSCKSNNVVYVIS